MGRSGNSKYKINLYSCLLPICKEMNEHNFFLIFRNLVFIDSVQTIIKYVK